MMGCVMLYSGVPKKVKQRKYQASKGKAVPFKYGFKPHRKRVRILVQIMESNTFIWKLVVPSIFEKIALSKRSLLFEMLKKPKIHLLLGNLPTNCITQSAKQIF